MLKEALGYIEGLGDQKIMLAQTSDADELIVGRFDLNKQEALYSYDGKEQAATQFEIVDGYILPKGEKAEEADAIGFQKLCPSTKQEGKHWCGLADTEQGLIPGKVYEDTCYYALNG